MRKLEYKLVDTAGQVTGIVINPVRRNQRADRANQIMLADQRIEQVGFLRLSTLRSQPPRFNMMGGELCINGTLAAGYWASQYSCQKNILLKTSGINDEVKISRTRNQVSALFPDLVHQNYWQ